MTHHKGLRVWVLVFAVVFLTPISVWAQTAERYLLVERPSALVHSFNVSDGVEVGSARAGTSADGIAVSSNGRLAFVANLNANYISVIDLTINAEIERIHGLRALHLALNADGTRLVVPICCSGSSQNSDRVDIVDTSTFQVIQSVSLNGLLGDSPANGDDIGLGAVVVVGSRAYINTSFRREPNRPIAVVDLTTFAVSTVTGSGIGNAPFGSSMAATPDGNHIVALRVGTRRLLVIDTDPNSADFNTVVQSIDPGSRPLAVAITRDAADPDGIFGYLVRAGSPGILDAINPTTGQVVSTAALPFSTLSPAIENSEIALTADSNRAYVITADTTQTNNVAVVDTGLLLSNPPATVINQFRVGTDLRGVAVETTQATPPGTAPEVTGIDTGGTPPGLVVNDTATTIHVSGSGFAPDARVRVGSLDPLPATFVSSSQLDVVVPAGAPAQGADIIVTNPNPLAPVSDQQQSGILRGQLVIASPPTFQPPNQVLANNFGEGTTSVLNISTNATVTPTTAIGPQPLGLAISPDGERAYVVSFPAEVKAFNIISNQVEATIPFNPATLLGQTQGIAIAPNPATGRPVAYVVDGVFVGPGFDERLNIIDADPTSPTFNSVIDTLQAGLTDGQFGRGALAASPDGHFVYANSFNRGATEGRLVVFDVLGHSATVHTLSSLGVNPIDTFLPFIHVTPDGRSLLMPSDEPSLTQVDILVFDISNDPTQPTLIQTIVPPFPPGLTTISPFAFQVVGNRLFGFDPLNQAVEVLNFNRSATPPAPPDDFSFLGSFVITPATPGIFSAGLAVTPDGSLIYAALREDDAVAVLDTAKVIAGDPSALLTKVHTGLAPTVLAVRPGTPTTAGTNVAVQPIQEVVITFDNVTSAGGTTATTTNTNPNPTPAGFAVGDPPIYYEINSSATFTGPIEVCFSYDETQFTGPESDLRVLHEENGMFVDRTVSLDTANNIICAQVDSFSSFVVGLGSVDFLFDTLLDAINDAVEHPGLRRSLRALVLAARDARDRGDAGAAIQQLNALKQEIQAQTGRNISESDASRLINLADSIISRF